MPDYENRLQIWNKRVAGCCGGRILLPLSLLVRGYFASLEVVEYRKPLQSHVWPAHNPFLPLDRIQRKNCIMGCTFVGAMIVTQSTANRDQFTHRALYPN